MKAKKFTIACDIIKKLSQAGYLAYFAGGWVRDYLLGLPSDDIDIATTAPVEAIQSLFTKTAAVGIQFGIVIVIENNQPFEVATFRKDKSYHDGRRPEGYLIATPEEDAQRRDFTINGLFYDPIHNKIFDYVSGKEDLKKGLIRAIGNPIDRFEEDKLRMIRAVRYAHRFQFEIETKTKEAIITQASSLFPAVSIERVWQELKKMSSFPDFDKALLDLDELGLFVHIFPMISYDKVKIRKNLSLFCKLSPACPLIIRLLFLLSSLDSSSLDSLCSFFKVSNEEKTLAESLLENQILLEKAFQKTVSSDSFFWAQFLSKPLFETALDYFLVSHPEAQQFVTSIKEMPGSLTPYIEWIQKKDFPLKAKHLLDAGISPGPLMGELLKEGERLAVNHQIDKPYELISLLKRHPKWPQ